MARRQKKRPEIEGMSPRRFLKYVDSLPETDPELNDELTRLLLQRTDLMVEAVKALRRIAVDPKSPPKLRKRAQAALKERQLDDESLNREDESE